MGGNLEPWVPSLAVKLPCLGLNPSSMRRGGLFLPLDEWMLLPPLLSNPWGHEGLRSEFREGEGGWQGRGGGIEDNPAGGGHPTKSGRIRARVEEEGKALEVRG